ncbi:hypothetical protein EJ04DRAFT_477529 [Polyplosphaeria fusca]|uniref:Glycosyl transferase CAP10 domain-containing protein n=1 Tax=Polyplosphaeria fusca TaxID=682080 RepID=A0A9P4QKU1_9PLEO|nr:hypothetical protein EJ04DRAFT_477529 [Polyplosphaeria fusca]
MAKQSHDLSRAAGAYRERRGRHPPPGFKEWFNYAQAHDAVIVEDLFDQIYHDLTPFWALEPKALRHWSQHFEYSIGIRNGKATLKTNEQHPFLDQWFDLVSTIQHLLPDVDIPLNFMDETRVVAPFEDINEAVREERSSRHVAHLLEVVTQPSAVKDESGDEPLLDAQWIREGQFWDIARVACSNDTPARTAPAMIEFSNPPPMPSSFPDGSYHGYVHNWTQAKDLCLQPDLRGTHGTFISQLSLSITHSLVPIFGHSKLSVNNDILMPAPMYWTDDPFYSGGEDTHGDEWGKKQGQVMWRGTASGGRNSRDNWKAFHRHRFVSMVNGTAVRLAEQDEGQGPNFDLHAYKDYHLTATKYMDLGTWLNDAVDVGFTFLECWPPTKNAQCPYTDPYFQVKEKIKMQDQYAYKFLPDIDGNSYSGRYRGFLRSTSLPIKATVYSEWHDSRLVPWLHFVPMHNSFVDIYGILDYFIGSSVPVISSQGEWIIEGAHDDQAKKIALAGKEWADKVLRKEDMLIYVMRLLMEYARLCDDHRARLGFIGDL